MEEKVLDKIYKASLKLLIPQTPEETYKVIVSETVKLVKAQYGSILLQKEGSLTRVYASTPELYSVVPRKRGYMYKVYKSHKPKILKPQDINKIHPSFKNIKIGNDIIIPLSYKNKSLGVLSIMSKPKKTLGKEDLLILKYFGPLATLAIIKSQLFSEVSGALQTRDLFISMASHELKTPLTTIYAYTQLASGKIKKGQPLTLEWANKQLSEIKRLTDLINELLQVSQIQKGDLNFQSSNFNVSDILQQAVSDFKLAHPSKKINFLIENKKVNILGDSSKIHQVFNNLLNNAAKHSQTSEPITVKLTLTNKYVTIAISDKGVGISKKDLSKVFDQFYRGNHKKEGMGLGLFLVKKIIDQHKGSISLQSKINKGTTIIINLPLTGYDK